MILLCFSFPLVINKIRPAILVQKSLIDSLLRVEEIALQKGEYPVGALLVYKDSILGTGYNTFRHCNNPTGHAEINAINEAFQSMHYLQFELLNRDSLIMITSYEPCMMCKGVMNHYDIRKIYYLKPKENNKKIKYLIKDLSYWLKLRRIKYQEE